MSAVEERFVLERTVTTENGRTVLRERRYSIVLDAKGRSCLRSYRSKYIPLRQETAKNRGEAA